MANGSGHDQAVETRNRHSQAYEGLRSLLLSGDLAPGTRLTEAELTGMFNVSRSTMRSVLVQLAQEGYVTSEVNRGVRTRNFSPQEAADILEAREVLESALAGKAAERATEEEIRELRATLEAMEDCKRRGDQAGTREATAGSTSRSRKPPTSRLWPGPTTPCCTRWSCANIATCPHSTRGPGRWRSIRRSSWPLSPVTGGGRSRDASPRRLRPAGPAAADGRRPCRHPCRIDHPPCTCQEPK